MTARILVTCLAAVLIFGCAKKKVAEPTETPSGQGDTNIQSKDMTFDVQGSDSGNISGLYTIHFDYDKSNLTSEGRGLAQKNFQWLKEHEGVKIQIEGHCDRHGSIEYNLALGERRARAVKAYMVNLGADSSRLSTISYGKEKPLDASETEGADAKNRRANFVVQK